MLLAAAAAVLLATLPGTLERSPVDRAAHAAGGDVRASGLAGLADAGEGERRAAIAGAGLDAASPLVREAGVLDREGSPLAVEVLGIDPASFGAAANVRPDLTADPLPAVLSTLSANSTALEGHPVPASSRQIGAWVRLTDTSGEVRIALSLRSERGRYVQLLIGVGDAEPGGGPWLFHAADLATPLDIDGAPIPAADLAGRLTLHGFYLLLGEDAAAAPGSALLGPVLTSLEAPAAPRDRIDRLSAVRESFEQREVVHSLADLAGLEPIDGLAAGGASVGARDTIPRRPASVARSTSTGAPRPRAAAHRCAACDRRPTARRRWSTPRAPWSTGWRSHPARRSRSRSASARCGRRSPASWPASRPSPRTPPSS